MGPGWPGVIEAYRDFLPASDDTPVVTLQEGGTPLPGPSVFPSGAIRAHVCGVNGEFVARR